MIATFGPLRKWVLGMDLKSLDFNVLGFNLKGEARERLERVSMTVVEGYNAAVELGYGHVLMERMQMVDNELRGFFAEGIAMGLFAWDRAPLTAGTHLSRFIGAEGRDHEYMAYIGAGLAAALFRLNPAKHVKAFDPLSGPLFYDGYGFYHAYFKPEATFNDKRIPAGIASDAFLQARFDGGVGRALWFYAGGDVNRITEIILRMSLERQGGIWAGIGLAATYAGGVRRTSLAQLLDAAGKHRLKLGLGSSLAVHARHRAGNPHEDDFACRLFTGYGSPVVHAKCVELAEPLQGLGIWDGRPALMHWMGGLEGWLEKSFRNINETSAHAHHLESRATELP